MIRFWKNILKMSIPIVFIFILAILLKTIVPIHNEFILIVQIILYTLLYVLSMYRFSINKYEKQLILEPINKIVRRSKNA